MTLEQVRADIDAIDDQVVELLARRQVHVRRAAAFKQDEHAVRAPERRRTMMVRLRARAAEAGLDPTVVDAVYTAMVDAFVALELDEHARLAREPDGES